MTITKALIKCVKAVFVTCMQMQVASDFDLNADQWQVLQHVASWFNNCTTEKKTLGVATMEGGVKGIYMDTTVPPLPQQQQQQQQQQVPTLPACHSAQPPICLIHGPVRVIKLLFDC